jgi:3-deoxy-D-manno-octulosonic-acid transferase
MYLLYSLALSCLFALCMPFFVYQAIRHGKYLGSFKERLGFLPEELIDSQRPTIWIHTVSVGEFNAARPLFEQLKKALPDYRLVVSTTTMTGQQLARKECPQKIDASFYFPFDWKFSVCRALNQVQPCAVIILETEVWPRFLHECKLRGIKTAIVNGRISPRSFARYSIIRRFIARTLSEITLLIMQSEPDAERAILLGASPRQIHLCGNMKYDVDLANPDSALRGAQLDRLFHLSSTTPLIVAGSTAPGEEAILLDSMTEVRKTEQLGNARLLIAPRHPERFNEVAHLIASSGFKWVRRSETRVASEASHAADVILLDSIGELTSTYQFAQAVFVGGSLVAKGGHNIIEPAYYAKPIIVGPHTENFRQIIADFSQADAVLQLKTAGTASLNELTATIIRLLKNQQEATPMGKRAFDILLKNRGATDCVCTAIQKILTS